MDGGIYLIQSDGQLLELTEQDYDSEELLQRLLAQYPHLLAGKQIDPSFPRRWMLVSREAGLPSEKGGAGNFAVDHLFIDQDSIPTLVEVKRSSDTRIRREVVGQMLDYAANAVAFWPVETIRGLFEAHCQVHKLDPDQVLAEFLESGTSPEEFWRKVGTNLQVGRIRMLFVADQIPAELQRIIEFLNEQMSQAEVLAVEIKQFVGQGLRSLVPRVIGQTSEAKNAKAGTRRGQRTWDESSFLQELGGRHGPEVAEIARKILEWAQGRMSRIWWGTGLYDGSFIPVLDHHGTGHTLICVWTYGRVEMQFQYLLRTPPFADEAKRRELLGRLNTVPTLQIPANLISRRPAFPLTRLADKAALQQFLEALDWAVKEIAAS